MRSLLVSLVVSLVLATTEDSSCDSSTAECRSSSEVSLDNLLVVDEDDENSLDLLQRKHLRKSQELLQQSSNDASRRGSGSSWAEAVLEDGDHLSGLLDINDGDKSAADFAGVEPDKDEFMDSVSEDAVKEGLNMGMDEGELAPIVLQPKRTRGYNAAINLHFNAVMETCGDQVKDATSCEKTVEKSSKLIFAQLHLRARLQREIAPLTKNETKAFEERFTDLVVGDSKHVFSLDTHQDQYDGWKNLVLGGYNLMRPVVPKSVVDYVNRNEDKLGWTAEYDPALPSVSVGKASQRLGFVMTEAELKMIKNDTETKKHQDLLEIGAKRHKLEELEFDIREHWPECKPVTTHVRFQTCNNCWSHSTALVTESRLCIQFRGQFNGRNAWLSQSYIAACRTDGQNYCMGGGGLLGFQTVSRWGVPTGGPDFRGNMQAGVQTCYPQVLPNQNEIHCPGSCSPYVRYPRKLTEDLFHVRYQPRALSPNSDQTLYLVRQAMMEEGPVLLGLRIYQDFYAYRSGIYRPAKASWNRYMGGHAVTGMGFGPGYMLCINSWSEAWGMRGAFKLAEDSVDFGYFLPGQPIVDHGMPTLMRM